MPQSEGQKDREELQAELNSLITSVFRRYKRLSYFQVRRQSIHLAVPSLNAQCTGIS